MHTMLSGMSTGRMYLLGARRGRARTRATGRGRRGRRGALRSEEKIEGLALERHVSRLAFESAQEPRLVQDRHRVRQKQPATRRAWRRRSDRRELGARRETHTILSICQSDNIARTLPPVGSSSTTRAAPGPPAAPWGDDDERARQARRSARCRRSSQPRCDCRAVDSSSSTSSSDLVTAQRAASREALPTPRSICLKSLAPAVAAADVRLAAAVQARWRLSSSSSAAAS